MCVLSNIHKIGLKYQHNCNFKYRIQNNALRIMFISKPLTKYGWLYKPKLAM